MTDADAASTYAHRFRRPARKDLSPAPPERLTSIDALRGFDMFWIAGGDDVAKVLCKWWGTPQARQLADQFEHVEWEGFRFYDLIFPLFLFLVGVVLPFSLRKSMTGEHPKSHALQRTARRVVLLFLLGLIYNGLLSFHFDALRVPGVLQRIAVCYGIASLDLPVHEGPHPGDPVRRDPGGLLGDPDVCAVARVEDRRRPRPGDQPGRLSRPALSPGKIKKLCCYQLWRQRGAALDDPGGRHGAAGRAGRSLAALGPQPMAQGPRPGDGRRGLPGPGHVTGASRSRSSRSSGPARTSWSRAAGACCSWRSSTRSST